MFKVTHAINKNTAIIYINNIPHLCIRDFNNFYAFQSYYDGENDSVATIELYFKNQKETIKLEYSTDEKWIAIIDKLIEIITNHNTA